MPLWSRLATHDVFLVLVAELLLRPCFASIELMPNLATFEVDFMLTGLRPQSNLLELDTMLDTVVLLLFCLYRTLPKSFCSRSEDGHQR